MTRQKAIPLRPLRDHVRYKTNVADINLEDLILSMLYNIRYKKLYLLLCIYPSAMNERVSIHYMSQNSL
jgi:hypothetical protein